MDKFYDDADLKTITSRKKILIANLERVLDLSAGNVQELDSITYANAGDLSDKLNTGCVHVQMKGYDGKLYDVYHFGLVYGSSETTGPEHDLVKDEALRGYTIILKSGESSKTNINNNLRIVTGGFTLTEKAESKMYALKSSAVSSAWDGLLKEPSMASLKKVEPTDVIIDYPTGKEELYEAFFKTIQLDIDEKAKTVKAPTKIRKENTKLPMFVDSTADKIYGYWDFAGKIPTAVVGDAKARPFREALKTNKPSKKNEKAVKKTNKKNEEIRQEIDIIDEWLATNKDVADPKQVLKKENKRAELVDKIVADRSMRIYAVKNEGGNGKVDFYVYLGNGAKYPKTIAELTSDSNVYKVRKAGFEVMNKTYTPVIEVYGKPYKKGKDVLYGDVRRIVDATRGGSEQLKAFVEAFAQAEKAEDKEDAFQEHFYKHISDALAKDLDKQKNEYYDNIKTKKGKVTKRQAKKFLKQQSSGFKSGTFKSRIPEKVLTFAIGAGFGALVAAGVGGALQIPGYAFDADNINRVRDGAREGAETQIAQTLERSRTAEGGTLFDYQTLNNENNYIIDSGSTESKIQSLVKNLSDIGAIGYTQKDIDNTINDAAIMAVTNLVSGYTYDEVARESSFATLGEKAGKEVGEKNIPVDKNKAIYPTASGITTSKEDFVSSLETNGMTEEQATKVADAYTNSFVASYEANYGNEISDGGMEVPEEDFDLNDSQGNLQETVNAITGDNILIVNVHYNDSEKNGVIYGINEEGNLKEISFENTTDIAVTSAEGLETALLSDPEPEIKEYASLDGLMFDDYTRNNIYNNLTDENGRIFYQITGVPTHDEEIEVETENENGSTTTSTTTVTINAHYDTVVVTLDKNFNVDKASVNVYSNSGKTESKEGIVKTAVSEITDGKVPGSPALYTLTSEEPETSSYPNQLSQESIEQAQEALREELSNENTNGTQIVPVSKERTRQLKSMPKWHAFLSLISKIIQTERKIKGEKIKKKNTNKNNPLQSCDQLTNVMRVAFGR